MRDPHLLVLGPVQYAFGPRTGLWVVVPFQVIVMVGEHDTAVCGEARKQSQWFPILVGIGGACAMRLCCRAGLGIVYMVTGGSSMLRVWQLYGDNDATPFGLSAWILVFFGLQLFLSQVTTACNAAHTCLASILCNMTAAHAHPC